MRASAAALGGDARCVALAGDSAGGNAAVAVALQLRDLGEAPPRAPTLLCPWLDMTLSSESYRRLAPRDPILDHASMHFLIDCYLGGRSPRDPLASPILADLFEIPETPILVGEIDPLCSDGVTFVRRLEAQGGRAEMHAYPGMPHDFICYPWLQASQRALDDVTRFQRRVLAPRSSRAQAG